MLSTIAALCQIPVRRGSKIYPERIIASDNPRLPTTRKDPCGVIYAKHKESGAYEKYKKTLSSPRIIESFS